mmetsp:Transcript_21320/g.25029  ORF Transcript_21320/g.25029 Transcript_21320/m.25029 type:complete len:93 (-) Transcript_21320:68-346(-)
MVLVEGLAADLQSCTTGVEGLFHHGALVEDRLGALAQKHPSRHNNIFRSDQGHRCAQAGALNGDSLLPVFFFRFQGQVGGRDAQLRCKALPL